MDRACNRIDSTRYTRERNPVSPTAFPGAAAVEEAEASVLLDPLFPDMRRDEFMSSTVSSKEVASTTNNYNISNRAGDRWSVSTASEEHYRAPHQTIDREPRRIRGRRDERDFESRDLEPRGRNDHSIDRKMRNHHVETHHRGRSIGRVADRIDRDDYDSPQDPYDQRYVDRRVERFSERSDDRLPATERRRQQDTHRPQHMYGDDDDYSYTGRDTLDPRNLRFDPRDSRIPVSPRLSTTPTRSERVYDRDNNRRAISPTRTDYARRFANEHEEYERSVGRRRSKSPRNWNVSSGIREGSLRFREESSDEDDDDDVNFVRPRATSRRRSSSREMGKTGRSQPMAPYESRTSRGRGHLSKYDDQHWASPRSLSKNFRYGDEGDDGSDFLHTFETVPVQRRGRRTVKYEEGFDDDSSVSSLNVESGISHHLEEIVVSRARSPDRLRTIAVKAPRRRSKSREKKETTEFVIDIAQSFDDDREVTFSPSTEAPYRPTFAAASHGSDDHQKRIADANLMKEQSEARHQILKEIRQAMEMRDLTHDAADRLFWDRQVNTLNASLRNLWDHHNVHDSLPGSVEHGRMPTYGNPVPTTVRETHAVNNYTTVKVQAPENLPAGHQFTIRVNGKPLKAQVPSGGVRKGDIFTIRIPLNASTTPVGSSSNVAKATIKVRAPASLPAGYRFTAKMGERTIVATVPPGGVQKGEIFTVPVSS